MHTGCLDVIEAGNGPRQLTFQAATIAGRLHELAGAQPLFLVENLETDVAVVLRNTGAGQLQAGPGYILGLDQQRT
ncbi:hypothetical protein D3C85_881760 [compost metagenome]